MLKDGTSVWWQVQSRNKRSVALDLRCPEGQAIARKLAAESDILIKNPAWRLGRWSMEHGLATLVLAGRAPRIDSDVDPEMMIDFAINMFLAAVVVGPEAFKKALGHTRSSCAPPQPRR